MRFLKCAAVTALSLVLLTTTCFAAASVPYDTYTIDTDDYSENADDGYMDDEVDVAA